MIRSLMLSGLLLFSAGTLAAEELAATLLKAEGKGRVVLPGGAAGEYRSGAMLQAGARLVTESPALAVLLMEDGSKVNVGPNTELTLERSEKEGDRRSTVFELFRGLIKASVKRLAQGSVFEVRTLSAVAAVKGTEYEVEVGEDGATEARVRKGTVWLEDKERRRKVVVRERMAARAERSGELKEARRLRREELRRLREWSLESLPRRGGSIEAEIREARARAFWERLRPEERRRILAAFRDSFSELIDEVTTLRAEERQARWRQRLRDSDERGLAGDEAKVDLALRKSGLDRRGNRVRFEEYLLRPASDQLQFLNYTRREGRTDFASNLKTYNRDLPRMLSEARGLNQKSWDQVAAPQYWVVKDVSVLGNKADDNFAATNWFFDPVRMGVARWDLPLKESEIRLNVADPRNPSGGILLETWTRRSNGAALGSAGAGSDVVGTANPNAVATKYANNYISAATGIGSNMVWALNDPLPGFRFLGGPELGTAPGDLATGFRRDYHGANEGRWLEFRTYAIDENGQVLNIARLAEKGPVDAFIQVGFRTFQELEVASNAFRGGNIDVVSQLMWMHNISKTRDDL